MKKGILFFLLISLIFTMCACSKKEESDVIEDVIVNRLESNSEKENEEQLIKDKKDAEDFNKIMKLEGLFINTIIVNNDGIISLLNKNKKIYEDYANLNNYNLSYSDYNSIEFSKKADNKEYFYNYKITENNILSCFEMDLIKNDSNVDDLQEFFDEIKNLYGIDLSDDFNNIKEIYNSDKSQYNNIQNINKLQYSITYSKYMDSNDEGRQYLSFYVIYEPENGFVDEYKEISKKLKKSLSKQTVQNIGETFNKYIDIYKEIANYSNFNFDNVENELNYQTTQTFYENKPIEPYSDEINFNKGISFTVSLEGISSAVIYTLEDLKEEDVDMFLEQCNLFYGVDLRNYKDQILESKDLPNSKTISKILNIIDYEKTFFLFSKSNINGQTVYTLSLNILNH